MGLAMGISVMHSPVAMAHTDAVLAEMTAPHGGQMRVAGAYHLELVIEPKADGKTPASLTVHVTDHDGKAADVKAVKGSITLLGTGGKSSAELMPASEGAMKGSATYVADTKLKAVVNLVFPGGKTEQARFAPLDKK